MSRHAAGPANDAIPVTPSDTKDILPNCDPGVGLYIETGGNIRVITAKGETRTLAVADYSHHPLCVSRVLSTGTTATGIHILL